MRLFQFAAVVCCCILLSCKNEDPAPIGPQVSTLTASVNGKNFSATDIQSSWDATSLYVDATANSGTSKASGIAFLLLHLNTLGTYNIDTAHQALYTEPGATCKALSGSVTISTNNEAHVAGTFAFQAMDSVTHYNVSVTNGTFDIYK